MTRPRAGHVLALRLVLPLLAGAVIGCEAGTARDGAVRPNGDVSAEAAPTSTTSADAAPSFSALDGGFVASVLPSGVDVVVVDNAYENPVGDRLRLAIFSDSPSGAPIVTVTVNRGSERYADAQDLAAQAASRVENARTLASEDAVEVKGYNAVLYRAPDDPSWTHVFWQEGGATVDVGGFRLEPADLVRIAEGLRATER
jgi:hypothetical protein